MKSRKNDYEFYDNLNSLVENGFLDKGTASYGIAKKILGGGLNSLTPKQLNVYWQYIYPALEKLEKESKKKNQKRRNLGIDKDATSILPKDGYGYIYVLSSPSISGVHKVGMTTKCVSERIKELNSTGVPQSFIAERIFEVEVIHLKEIEKLAHKKLKTKGFHYGKEFFQASIEECDLAINYAINLISKTNGIELIKKKRDEIDQKKKEGELIDKEIDILLRKYLFLEWVNRDIYRKAMSKRENLQIVNTQGQNGLLTLLKIACAITLIAIGPVGWGIGIFLLWASSKQPKPPAISYPQIHFLGEELFSVLDIARGVDEYNISENDLGDKCVTFIERLDEENSINWEYGVKESRAALYCRSNPLIMSEDFKVSTFFSDKDMTDMGFYSKYTKLHKKEYIYVAVPMNKENDEYGDNNSFFLINLADKNARDNLSQRIQFKIDGIKFIHVGNYRPESYDQRQAILLCLSRNPFTSHFS